MRKKKNTYPEKIKFFRLLVKTKHFIIEQLVQSKFTHLLSALIILFIFSPNLEVRDPVTRSPIGIIIFAIVLFTALRAIMQRGPLFWTLSGIIALDTLLNVVLYFLPAKHNMIFHLEISNSSISILFYFITIVYLSKYLFKVKNVTADTIKGGICAYMLIGFAWANIYGLIMKVRPDSFAMPNLGEVTPEVVRSEMMYTHFSFTTLTTLGYGDIVPNSHFAAVISNGEAIVGQLFLTIFVARLVGLYIAEEMYKERND